MPHLNLEDYTVILRNFFANLEYDDKRNYCPELLTIVIIIVNSLTKPSPHYKHKRFGNR